MSSNLLESCKDSLNRLEAQKLVIENNKAYWSDFLEIATSIFEEISKEHNQDFFYIDNIRTRDDKNKYLQLSFKYRFTGGYEFRDVESKGSPVMEHGCSLVYSQGLDGKIIVVFYPFKSEHSKPLADYYVYNIFSPKKLQKTSIEKHIKILLSYAHYSSTFGDPNWTDWYRYTIMRLCSIWLKLSNSDLVKYSSEIVPDILKRVIASKFASNPNP